MQRGLGSEKERGIGYSLAAGARTSLTFSARAHFLKRGGKVNEIPPQSRYSRFTKLRDSNGL